MSAVYVACLTSGVSDPACEMGAAPADLDPVRWVARLTSGVVDRQAGARARSTSPISLRVLNLLNLRASRCQVNDLACGIPYLPITPFVETVPSVPPVGIPRA